MFTQKLKQKMKTTNQQHTIIRRWKAAALSCLLSVTTFVPASSLWAQDSLLLRNYSYITQADPWLTGSNTAAITRYDAANIAEAELSLNAQKGGFTNFSDAKKGIETKAGIESFYRVSRRTVLFGAMSFVSFSGKDMAGSVFMPQKDLNLPFDIVEDSLTNTGTKRRDTYRLTGAFGSEIYRGMAIGARVDYIAANYAKYKDLRHQNKLMDLQLSAGIYIPLTTWMNIGANYLYRRNVESLNFSTFGNNDKVYKSLADYGAMMGHVEQFGNDGYTTRSHELPLVDDFEGGSAQFEIKFAPVTRFFNTFTYAHRTGYYGSRSPYTITYAEHESDVFQYKARLTTAEQHTLTYCDFYLNIENLTNRGNTYRELQNASKATYYEYYVPVKLSNKFWMNCGLAYTLHLGLRTKQQQTGSLSDTQTDKNSYSDALPTWTLQAGANWMQRRQTAYLYPYYRRQDIASQELFANATYHLLKRKGLWSFTVSGQLLSGEGKPYEDLTFETPSDRQQPPATMEAWLMREHQYLTASQYAVCGQVKYSFILSNTRLKPHVRLSLSHRKANNTNNYSNGCDQLQGSIAVGCTF